jgi:hypothetical protein
MACANAARKKPNAAPPKKPSAKPNRNITHPIVNPVGGLLAFASQKFVLACQRPHARATRVVSRHAGNTNIQTAKPSAVSDQRLCLRPRSGCRTSSKTPVRGFTDVPILPFSETGTRSPTVNNNVPSAAFLRPCYVEFQTFGSNSNGGCAPFSLKEAQAAWRCSPQSIAPLRA